MIDEKEVQQHIANLVKDKIEEKDKVLREIKTQSEWVLEEYIRCVNDNDDITHVLQQMIETLKDSLKK